MLQRDNLVRSLGVFDQVHRMLSGGSAPTQTNENQKVFVLVFLTAILQS